MDGNNGSRLLTPALPTGGTALPVTGMDWAVTPEGSATLMLPLPVSACRGTAPPLFLTYRSDAGNSNFGRGWDVGIPSISRRTSHGTPRFDDSDVFVGPDGQWLTPGEMRNADRLGGLMLSRPWAVRRFHPRIDHRHDRIELWQTRDRTDRWVVYEANGSIAIYGDDACATLSDANDTTHIAQWFLREAISPLGEHVVYEYQPENGSDVDDDRDISTARYLRSVRYGNTVGSTAPYTFEQDSAPSAACYFELVFDYGERSTDPAATPTYLPQTAWTKRADPFSDFRYGFEHRTLRLCRQVLMFHRLDPLGPQPVLVRRMLFDYDEQPWLTRLIGVQSIAYGALGDIGYAPPIDISWYGFDPSAATAIPMGDYPGVDDGFRGNLTDLYGEGLPGILHRDADTWTYREPRRAPGTDHAITYGEPIPLKAQPSAKGNDAGLHPRQGMIGVAQPPAVASRRLLAETTQDGRLSWIVVEPSMRGYFTLGPDRTWSAFTPFPHLPPDFRHEHAQWADLSGRGSMDLVLVTAHAVHWWPRTEDGYGTQVTIPHDIDRLPLATTEYARVLFTDVLGAGHAQLVRVGSSGAVECWPSLGRGHFGAAISLGTLRVDDERIDPARLFFADIEGKGAADILYATRTGLLWFRNLSGHGFATAIRYAWPAGRQYERTWSVSFANVDGNGISAVITLPHARTTLGPSHWRIDFSRTRPHLVSGTNNNRGASTTLAYRNTAQAWLDRKSTRNADDRHVSHLPFAMMVVSTISSIDEIHGHIDRRHFQWDDGFYDGKERHFRGFAFRDVHTERSLSGDGAVPDTLVRTWTHIGDPAVDTQRRAFDTTDKEASGIDPPLFSRWKNDGDDIGGEFDAVSRKELWRSLAGLERRAEAFTVVDGRPHGGPHDVTEYRYLAREVTATKNAGIGVSLPMMIESLAYHYEDTSGDPRRVKQLELSHDAFGWPRRRVRFACARRDVTSPFDDPETRRHWEDSHDEAQRQHHVTLVREMRWHLTTPDAYCLFVPAEVREEAAFVDATIFDESEMYYERFARGLGLPDNAEILLVSLVRTVYADDPAAPPMYPPLPRSTCVAGLDALALAEYRSVMDAAELDDRLRRGGWRPMRARLLLDGEQLHATDIDLRTYESLEAFHRVSTIAPCRSIDPTMLETDATGLFVAKWTMPGGLDTSADHDYRHLCPYRITDVNHNMHEVGMDAFGRALATSFHGTETDDTGNVIAVGFTSMSHWNPPEDRSPSSALEAPVAAVADFAEVFRYDDQAWMGRAECTLDPVTRQRWLANRWITHDGHVRSHGRHADPALAVITRMPPHVAHLIADRFPGDPQMQVQQAVWHDNGYGQTTQAAKRVPEEASACWTVNEQALFHAENITLREYRPRFTADWHAADAPETAHTIFNYDIECRVTETLDPAGRIKRAQYHAWFQVIENENRTAEGNAEGTFGSPLLTAWVPGGSAVRQWHYYRRTRTETGILRLARTWTDAAGRSLRHYDPRSVTRNEAVRTQSSGLGGGWNWSPDAGEQWVFPADSGAPLWTRDATGNEHELHADMAGRAIAVHSRDTDTKIRRQVRRVDYVVPGQRRRDANVSALPEATYDDGGCEIVYLAAITGQVQTTERRLLIMEDPDWPDSGDGGLLETGVQITQLAYNALGRIVRLVDSDKNERQFGHDIAGRTTEVTFLFGDSTGVPYRAFSSARYNADETIASFDSAPDVKRIWTYDARNGQLINYGVMRTDGNRIIDRIYWRDPSGLTVGIDDATTPITPHLARKRTFVYDSIGQLIETTGHEQPEAGRGPALPEPIPLPPGSGDATRPYRRTFDYDPNGNLWRVAHTVPGTASIDYSLEMIVAPLSNKALPAEPGLIPEDIDNYFDAAGRLMTLSPDGIALVWDRAGRLSEVDGEHYLYGADGIRLRKRSLSKNTVYLPGLERHIDGPNVMHIASTTLGMGSLRISYRPEDPSTIRVHHELEEHPLTASTVLDGHGAVVVHEEYYPFGGTSICATSSQIEMGHHDVRYSGERRDSSGLYYYGARYYMPWQWRWTCPDPAGNIDGGNRYRMVRNSPVDLRDEGGFAPVREPDHHTGPLSSKRTRRQLQKVPAGKNRDYDNVSLMSESLSYPVKGRVENATSVALNTLWEMSKNTHASTAPLSVQANVKYLPFTDIQEDIGNNATQTRAVGGVTRFVALQVTVANPTTVSTPGTAMNERQNKALVISMESVVTAAASQTRSLWSFSKAPSDRLRFNPQDAFQAYYAPQNGWVDIPKHPTGEQPVALLTPDFSGCSLVVRELDKTTYRVFHIGGGHENEQFNSRPLHANLPPITMMTFAHYGYDRRPVYGGGAILRPSREKQRRNSLAFAMMRYEDSAWSLRYQRQAAGATIQKPHLIDSEATTGSLDILSSHLLPLTEPVPRDPTPLPMTNPFIRRLRISTASGLTGSRDSRDSLNSRNSIDVSGAGLRTRSPSLSSPHTPAHGAQGNQAGTSSSQTPVNPGKRKLIHPQNMFKP